MLAVRNTMGSVLSYFEARLHRCDRRLDDLEAQVTKQEMDMLFLVRDLYKELESLYHKLEDVEFAAALDNKVRFRRAKHASLPDRFDDD